MSEPHLTLKGTIVPLAFNASKCKVALRAVSSMNENDNEDLEYPILSKGAGTDLADMVSNYISADCLLVPCEEEDCTKIHIRSYQILDELDENDLFAPEKE